MVVLSRSHERHLNRRTAEVKEREKEDGLYRGEESIYIERKKCMIIERTTMPPWACAIDLQLRLVLVTGEQRKKVDRGLRAGYRTTNAKCRKAENRQVPLYQGEQTTPKVDLNKVVRARSSDFGETVVNAATVANRRQSTIGSRTACRQ